LTSPDNNTVNAAAVTSTINSPISSDDEDVQSRSDPFSSTPSGLSNQRIKTHSNMIKNLSPKSPTFKSPQMKQRDKANYYC